MTKIKRLIATDERGAGDTFGEVGAMRQSRPDVHWDESAGILATHSRNFAFGNGC